MLDILYHFIPTLPCFLKHTLVCTKTLHYMMSYICRIKSYIIQLYYYFMQIIRYLRNKTQNLLENSKMSILSLFLELRTFLWCFVFFMTLTDIIWLDRYQGSYCIQFCLRNVTAICIMIKSMVSTISFFACPPFLSSCSSFSLSRFCLLLVLFVVLCFLQQTTCLKNQNQF